MFSLSYFQDPRFRRERIFWVLVIPLLIILLPGLVFLLYISQTEAPPTQTQEVSAITAEPPIDTPAGGLEEPPADPTAPWISAAEKACLANDKASAANLLQARSPTPEDSVLLWELTTRLQALVGDTNGAMETCRRGIRNAPSQGLHYQMALLLRQQGKLEPALEELNQALSLAPGDAVLSNQRYLLLLQMGKDEQVRGEITAQISTPLPPPANAWIMGVAGLALQKGQYAEAAQLLEQARQVMDAPTFQRLLESPVLSRHQNQPEIFPFFIRNKDILPR